MDATIRRRPGSSRCFFTTVIEYLPYQLGPCSNQSKTPPGLISIYLQCVYNHDGGDKKGLGESGSVISSCVVWGGVSGGS